MGILRGDREGKNEKKRVTSGDDDTPVPMRRVYAQMFRAHHILPDELARQDPSILFRMFDDLDDIVDDEEDKKADEDDFAGNGWMAGL